MKKKRNKYALINKNYYNVNAYCTVGLSGSNTDGLFTTAILNSFLSPMAADLGKFRVIFVFILKMVYCVYSLESPQ